MNEINEIKYKMLLWDFSGGPVVKMQGAQVQSLVKELDPSHMQQLRACMPQLMIPHATTKIPHTATKIPRAATKT